MTWMRHWASYDETTQPLPARKKARHKRSLSWEVSTPSGESSLKSSMCHVHQQQLAGIKSLRHESISSLLTSLSSYHSSTTRRAVRVLSHNKKPLQPYHSAATVSRVISIISLLSNRSILRYRAMGWQLWCARCLSATSLVRVASIIQTALTSAITHMFAGRRAEQMWVRKIVCTWAMAWIALLRTVWVFSEQRMWLCERLLFTPLR